MAKYFNLNKKDVYKKEDLVDMLDSFLGVYNGNYILHKNSNVENAIEFVKAHKGEFNEAQATLFDAILPKVEEKAKNNVVRTYSGVRDAVLGTGASLLTAGYAVAQISGFVQQVQEDTRGTEENSTGIDKNAVENAMKSAVDAAMAATDNQTTAEDLTEEKLNEMYLETVINPAVELMNDLGDFGIKLSPEQTQSLIYYGMLNSNTPIPEDIQKAMASLDTPISQLLGENFQQLSYQALAKAGRADINGTGIDKNLIDFNNLFTDNEKIGNWVNECWDIIVEAQKNPSKENVEKLADFYKDVIENYEEYNKENAYATFFVMNSLASPLQPGFEISEKLDEHFPQEVLEELFSADEIERAKEVGVGNLLISKYDSITQASRDTIYRNTFVTDAFIANADENLDKINDFEAIKESFGLTDEEAKQFKFTANYKAIPRENGNAFVGDKTAEDIAGKYRNFTVFTSKEIVSGNINSQNFDASSLFLDEEQANLVNETIKTFESGDTEKWSEIYRQFAYEVRSDRYNNPALTSLMFNLANEAHVNSNMKLDDSDAEIIFGQNGQRDIYNQIQVDGIRTFEEFENVLRETGGFPEVGQEREIGNEFGDATNEQDHKNLDILSLMDLEQNTYNMMLGELGAIKDNNTNFIYDWPFYDENGKEVSSYEEASYQERFGVKRDLRNPSGISKYQAIISRWSKEVSQENINRSVWINEKIAERTKDLQVVELMDTEEFFSKLNGVFGGSGFSFGGGGAFGAAGAEYVSSGKVIVNEAESSVTYTSEGAQDIEQVKKDYEDAAKKQLEEDPVETIVDNGEDELISVDVSAEEDRPLTDEEKQQNQDAVDAGYITEEERQELEDENSVIQNDTDWEKEGSDATLDDFNREDYTDEEWQEIQDAINHRDEEDLSSGSQGSNTTEEDNSQEVEENQETNDNQASNQSEQQSNETEYTNDGSSLDKIKELIDSGATNEQILDYLSNDANYKLDKNNYFPIEGEDGVVRNYYLGADGNYYSVEQLKEDASFNSSNTKTENVEEQYVGEEVIITDDDEINESLNQQQTPMSAFSFAAPAPTTRDMTEEKEVSNFASISNESADAVVEDETIEIVEEKDEEVKSEKQQIVEETTTVEETKVEETTTKVDDSAQKEAEAAQKAAEEQERKEKEAEAQRQKEAEEAKRKAEAEAAKAAAEQAKKEAARAAEKAVLEAARAEAEAAKAAAEQEAAKSM
jgi:AAA ATPase containing von Willebrand factor type A (vWA) domain